jgi:hypothetical protein
MLLFGWEVNADLAEKLAQGGAVLRLIALKDRTGGCVGIVPIRCGSAESLWSSPATTASGSAR